ncbi:tyrosine-type recombinase/integrase [Campylobacter suis]|nr:tyrosine-type recombinase/integrase [Campylobacter suis]
MRIKEMTQLTTDDIKEIDGVLCIDINKNFDTNLGKKKKVKTSSSIRLIPLHSKLVEIGFLNHIDMRKKKAKENGRAARIFFSDNKDFSEYFRKKINHKVIAKGNKSKTFYSFRHSFINKLLQANQRIEHIAALAGHEQTYNITAKTYGEQINPKILKDVVEVLRYG